MLPDNFDYGSENDFDVICNVVCVLSIEFYRVTKETKEEENEPVKESANHKPLCYYEMNNDCVDEDKAIFEMTDLGMKQHLKPILLWAKVENVRVNKVLVDGRAAINLIPHLFLKKIGISDIDLKPHNMVMSNYEGRMSYSLGVILVDIVVGTIVKPTLFWSFRLRKIITY